MQITEANELLNIENNEFMGELPKLTNTQINFKGKNNILICEEGVHLFNSRIDFNLDNSILYLSSNERDYCVSIAMHNHNVCYIGKNNYFNGLTTIVLSEMRNLVIGESCLFSYNITIRVADGHLIYNSKTQKRMNHTKSIFIGDHVWIGQNAMIFKGCQIGSGSIIGANSVLSNKHIPSNTTFAGNPPKLIHEDTFWTGHSVHGWVEEDSAKMENYSSELFIYKPDEKTLNFDDIEYNLNTFSDPEDIISYITFHFLNASKNRFSIGK